LETKTKEKRPFLFCFGFGGLRPPTQNKGLVCFGVAKATPKGGGLSFFWKTKTKEIFDQRKTFLLCFDGAGGKQTLFFGKLFYSGWGLG